MQISDRTRGTPWTSINVGTLYSTYLNVERDFTSAFRLASSCESSHIYIFRELLRCTALTHGCSRRQSYDTAHDTRRLKRKKHEQRSDVGNPTANAIARRSALPSARGASSVQRSKATRPGVRCGGRMMLYGYTRHAARRARDEKQSMR